VDSAAPAAPAQGRISFVDVVVPELGESIRDGTLTKWLVKPGGAVAKDQAIFEFSTDKVDTEIPSPVAGVLSKIFVQEGQKVPVGNVVARIKQRH
jgi:2-oxoglutarate dehydrogenase E2 component (dihydrolipoamide succinyltransferase)